MANDVALRKCLFKYIENSTSKNWNFSDKNSDIFHISVQNINCGYSLEPPRQGGTNDYSQPMFLNRNMKNNVYSYKSQFYYIKWGLRGSILRRHVFVMDPEDLALHFLHSICFGPQGWKGLAHYKKKKNKQKKKNNLIRQHFQVCLFDFSREET